MTPLLQLRGVTKRFGGLLALNGVSFDVLPASVVGIIGPNGAGKTTLFNVITGVFPPTSGEVWFAGQSTRGLRPHSLCKRGAARTFQITRPFAELTVFDTVCIGALNRSESLAEAGRKANVVLEHVGLDHKRHQLGKHLTVIERKRLEVARALATEPTLLLLDEVAAGLRPKEIDQIIGLINSIVARGTAVLIIEHVLEAVLSVSQKIVVISFGEVIAEGPPEELIRDNRVIEVYLGKEYNFA